MTRSWSPGAATDTWPWPPEVPRRPDQPPYPPYHPPEPPPEPSPPSPPSPTPILPTWEEPDPSWAERLVLDRLLDQRVIVVTGHLDERVAERVSAQLLLLDRTDHARPIELHLSCRGSDVAASVTLAAALDLVRADVHAVVSGTLSGPALAVVCAASERAAHRHATFVLTLPLASADSSAATAAVRAEEHQRALRQVVERIAAVAGRAEDRVEEDLRSGQVLSAEEARGYGLVDKLL